MTALPRRLPAHGSVKDRWLAHHRQSRYEVFLRCRGRCEAEDCTNAATELAHLFGRRHIIGEPWCSSPALTMGLCKADHQSIDRGLNPDLRERLQWVGLVRLCAAETLPISLLEGRSPEGAARAIEDALRARIVG